jgi:hypothetical protein
MSTPIKFIEVMIDGRSIMASISIPKRQGLIPHCVLTFNYDGETIRKKYPLIFIEKSINEKTPIYL